MLIERTQTSASLKSLVEAALGERPLTHLIKNAKLLNVFTGEIYEASIGIYRDRIVYVGDRDTFHAERILDGTGKTAIPGLIDTHLHVESSMVTPVRFAEAVLPHGTTTACADPHEIGNVLGKEGVRMMLENSRGLPLKLYFFAPTCIPESPASTAGAEITGKDVDEMLGWDGIVGLGEVMDYEGVIARNEKMMGILEAGHKHNAVIDGHCVLLSGPKLNAYIAVGPEADHENFTVESALEKLRAGMYVKLRGPHILHTESFVSALKGLPKPWNIIFTTDDVMPDHLMQLGHLDYVCRSFLQAGMDPVEVVRSATMRPAQHMRMPHLGGIAPGKIADIVLLKSLERFEVDTVFADGVIVAKNGMLAIELPNRAFDNGARGTVRLPKLRIEDFDLKPPLKDGKVKVNAIDFPTPNETNGNLGTAFLRDVLTNLSQVDIQVRNGQFILGEVALVLVFERHHGTARRAVGFVKNLIRSGAIASTVAHDAHNLIVVGTDRQDMYEATKQVMAHDGGIAAVKNGTLLSLIELPIAGLMSEESVEVVGKKMLRLREAFKEMGVLDHPYMPIPSLLTLSVIPHARITDKGIFDVDHQTFIDWKAAEN